MKNPYRLLRAAGLDDMQKVVEVGCGPGFFTIPAVRIVGEKGHVYAIDVNHRALKRVWKSWITNKWFWAGFFGNLPALIAFLVHIHLSREKQR